ncbi:3-deoxy-manno-octulosonate cytidylyltransferase [Halomonas smyrnensis]|uniref:3-deoxy-manno-octulosonate cytidylyltransferase n=1 Tax=Halomonas smyrnensis TaxID=720605 RepID=UPI0002DBF5DB|nr:3-deoxy-manno-octulosonate cytidylyltransferase [Halomonas smyrnensis]
MTVRIVIPARYGSSRLPGKPLADIDGKPMIQHVYERALTVQGATGVVVATDDERVRDAVEGFGGTAVMTDHRHESGTDRLVEVAELYPADIYVNIQGDEPLFRPSDVEQLIACMTDDASVDVATLYHVINADEASNPNSVKLVLNAQNDALYFSRSPIPYDRDGEGVTYRKHIGIYGYRHSVLDQYGELTQPMLETAEKLEQLRLLHAGFKIRAVEVAEVAAGVDTPECLDRVRGLMAGIEPKQMRAPALADVRLVITDVDGVLTDGRLVYDTQGECLKTFHVRDGLAIRVLEMSGITVAVLSGRDSAVLRKRLADLGINRVCLGAKDKRLACQTLMDELDIRPENTLFIGDDTLDLPAFEACGISVSVADAPGYIREAADIVLAAEGGQAAFRELADSILLAQGKFENISTAHGYENLSGFKTQ